MMAYNYEELNLRILCSPRNLSRSFAIGQETGAVKYIKNLTVGESASAIFNYWGPIQIAWGMTSPTKTTAITDIKIA